MSRLAQEVQRRVDEMRQQRAQRQRARRGPVVDDQDLEPDTEAAAAEPAAPAADPPKRRRGRPAKAQPRTPPSVGKRVNVKAAGGGKGGATVFLSGGATDLAEILTAALGVGKLSQGAEALATTWRARLTGVK